MDSDLMLPEGHVRAWTVEWPPGWPPGSVHTSLRGPERLPGVWRYPGPWQKNNALYEWATIVAKLLAREGTQYGISAMYIEFENLADVDDPITAPNVTRDADQGVEYYDGLADSGSRDYLRVPVISAVISSSDEVKYPKGNVVTFFAQTSGNQGVHGKTFSDSVNSKIYGGALVAQVDEDDATQDLVLSRFYFATASQKPKLANSQVGIEWPFKIK
jgi:hypothetical protein